jgi:hypothetical protein
VISVWGTTLADRSFSEEQPVKRISQHAIHRSFRAASASYRLSPPIHALVGPSRGGSPDPSTDAQSARPDRPRHVSEHGPPELVHLRPICPVAVEDSKAGDILAHPMAMARAMSFVRAKHYRNACKIEPGCAQHRIRQGGGFPDQR